jgi:hypothetical protein
MWGAHGRVGDCGRWGRKRAQRTMHMRIAYRKFSTSSELELRCHWLSAHTPCPPELSGWPRASLAPVGYIKLPSSPFETTNSDIAYYGLHKSFEAHRKPLRAVSSPHTDQAHTMARLFVAACLCALVSYAAAAGMGSAGSTGNRPTVSAWAIFGSRGHERSATSHVHTSSHA